MKTHGMTGTPTFNAWYCMISRCHRQNDASFPDYGGSGIVVCESWRHSFEAFVADMGPRPSPRHSLDRYPNQNGNYEPGNVRWATARQQARNRKNNHVVEFNGKSQCLMDWADEIGMNFQTLRHRLLRGYTFADAISRPLQKKRVRT